jgi:hypothetical protein
VTLLLVTVFGATWLAVGTGSDGRHNVPRTRRPHTPAESTASPAASSIPRGVSTTLVLWGSGQSYVDDLSTRQSSSQARVLGAIGSGDYQPLAAGIGNMFVFVGRGVSVSDTLLSGRRPHQLSRTSGFAPAADAGHIWLVSLRQQGRIVRLASLRNGSTGPAIHLPHNTALVRGTDAGMLLENYGLRGEPLELWRPGSAPALLRHSPAWDDGFSATPRLVAYGSGCHILSPTANYEPDACRMLRVLDVVTGKVASYPSPPDTLGWVPFGFNVVDSISRSGTNLAAVAAIAPGHADRGQLYTVALDHPSGRPTPVPGSTGFVRSRVAWSARGNWLFYQGPSQRLQAYQPSTKRIGISSTPCCQYTVMAAVPSSR